MSLLGISVEGDCDEGAALVAQLQTFFSQSGSPPQFQSAVDAIVASYQDQQSSWKRSLPFSPVCGEIKALGYQAKALMAQIASATGQQPPPDVSSPTLLGTLTLFGVAAILFGGYLLYKELK